MCVCVCTECELRRQAEELSLPISVLSARLVMDRITALQGDQDSVMMDSAQRVCHISHTPSSQFEYECCDMAQELLKC